MYCQLEYLGGCLPGRIRHALDELPATLDGTYKRTLREIKDTNWEFARRLLQRVTAAARPLRVEELAEFLAFDFKAGRIPKFREDWRLQDPVEAVLSTCSTLLSLVNFHNSHVNFHNSPVIQFSHFSVKEFLTSSRFAEKGDTISGRYHISMTPAHTLVAQACLGILLHLNGNVTKDSLPKFPLTNYAAEHWFEHARFEGVSQNVDKGMEQLFDQRKPHFAVWLWICGPTASRWLREGPTEEPLPPRGTSLHYASFCGLHDVVIALTSEHSQDIDSRSFNTGSTPLHLASGEGHTKVARVLIEHGAEVAAQDEMGRTPLSENGHVDLARFLVEHGADTTTMTTLGGLHCIVHPKGAMWISLGSSLSRVPTWQPKTKTGRLHCIKRPNGVMWVLHDSLSNTAPTQLSKTGTGGVHCIGRRLVVMWIWDESSSSMVPMWRPK